MTIRALSLDFGGTLATETPSRAALYAEAARLQGHPRQEVDVARAMGAVHELLPEIVDGCFRYDFPWFERFIDLVFGNQLGLPRSAIDGLRMGLLETFADAGNFSLLPGARAAISAAKLRGLTLAVTSNWSPALPGLLEGLGIAGDLDVVLVSASERLEKPDARLFQRTSERLGVAAHETLHVGNDLDRDVRGALAAGLQAAWVDPSGTIPPTQPVDAPVLRSLHELPALLARLS
jgi:FMN phosphatase YigB (HAD superfamily)